MDIRHLKRDAKVWNRGRVHNPGPKGLDAKGSGGPARAEEEDDEERGGIGLADAIAARQTAKENSRTRVVAASPPFTSAYKWMTFTANAFDQNEEAVLVTAREFVAEARRDNPGRVLYSPIELDMLARIRDDPDRLRMVHGIKRRFGGWLKRLDVDGKTYKAAAVKRRMLEKAAA